MKKYLLALVVGLACSCVAVSTSLGQTATFTFDDHNGVANAGTYNPTNSFTFSIMLNFVPGGTVPNIEGLSYYLEQNNPAAPFNFSISNRDLTGSPFSIPQTATLTYLQNLAPQNPNDLGAFTSGLVGMGAGNYFIANLTIFISGSTAPGTYIIESTVDGRTSIVSDDGGHTSPITRALYTITVVPETGSTALLLGLGVCGLACMNRQRRRI